MPILNWKKTKIEYDISCNNFELKKNELENLMLKEKHKIINLVNMINLEKELLELNTEKNKFYKIKYLNAKELLLRK